jgi:methionyl-tRNA formyltransferase
LRIALAIARSILEASMRILFIGGMYRGYRLAQQLLARSEEVVGAYVYEEDAHESPKYCGEIASLLSSKIDFVQATRRITADQLQLIRDQLAPDVIFCLGWRTLIPMEVLECAPWGGIAVHDSLLPRLRGFAPSNWGLILGHDQLGATLFQLTDSVDAGDVYFQEAIAPGPTESYESIQSRIAETSVRLFDRFLDSAQTGTLIAHRQNHANATYTCARSPADGEVDWNRSSHSISRLIRALVPPAPGAFTYLHGSHLLIVEAYHVEHPQNYEGRIPGRVVDRNPSAGTIDVLCGEGVLRIHRVRTCDGCDKSASSVAKSVRDSLGMNYSQEISSLRDRVDRLESLLSSTQPAEFLPRRAC